MKEKFIFLFWSKSKNNNNFGDELSYYIVNKLTSVKVYSIYPTCSNPSSNFLKKSISFMRICLKNGIKDTIKFLYRRNKDHILGLGSIINRSNEYSIVWGSGIISRNDKICPKSRFLVVRGKYTQNRLRDLGISSPEYIGDPGILISKIYNTKKTNNFMVGIIPHKIEFDLFNNLMLNDKLKVINLNSAEVEETINDICSCEYVISSSLHGIITAHSYGIPALWVSFGRKLSGDNIKFLDYFSSVNLDISSPLLIEPSSYSSKFFMELVNNGNFVCPKKEVMDSIAHDLIQNFPYQKAIRKEYFLI
ncbi:polysaccharide pyruvyl transferase family protein [Algoriphagus namhaensis]|uniref:Polysaccharide pyruvyl transferase family protein n=1 Tax=Algoriphagus namhaensis TaxID=915353 RepID=A0ABV8AVQ3_9BACT